MDTSHMLDAIENHILFELKNPPNLVISNQFPPTHYQKERKKKRDYLTPPKQQASFEVALICYH